MRAAAMLNAKLLREECERLAGPNWYQPTDDEEDHPMDGLSCTPEDADRALRETTKLRLDLCLDTLSLDTPNGLRQEISEAYARFVWWPSLLPTEREALYLYAGGLVARVSHTETLTGRAR